MGREQAARGRQRPSLRAWIAVAVIAVAATGIGVAAAATIGGTPGPDTLEGTKRSERIAGFGGADEINGRGGRDRLFGGAGGDRLSGGTERDKLGGGSGPDRLRGGSGTDRLSGGSGRDQFSTRNGVLLGSPGGDVIRARDGSADEIDCDTGFDKAFVDEVEDGVYNCERVIAPGGEIGQAVASEGGG